MKLESLNLDTFHDPIPSELLKYDTDPNMYFILSTLDTSHDPIFTTKEVAPENMLLISVTLDTFQSAML
jgi:hypothetical protein